MNFILDLNVFHSWGYSKRYYITHPHKWFRHLYLNIKHAWQRITRGYCDEDWWNLGYWLLNILPPMLDDLADNANGWPQQDGFPEFEDWQKYLRGIAANLRLCTEEAAEKMNEYQEAFSENARKMRLEAPDKDGNRRAVWYDQDEDINKKYFDRCKEISEEQAAIREDTFYQIAQSLPAMWD